MRPARLAAVAALASFALQPACLQAAQYPLIGYDGFEECALGYRDLDGDGFGGADDVAHRCDPLPADMVRIGGDCADGDPESNPDAVELLPDAALKDENCDGVDGDVALAVFVAPGGSTDLACGARTDPCALSVAAAVAAGSGKSQLFLATGEHVGPLVLTSASPVRGIFGGYSADFVSRAISDFPRETRVHGAVAVDADAFALSLSGSAAWMVTDLAFLAPGTTAQAGTGEGLGSVGIQLGGGAALDLRRSDAVAGNAADGTMGSDGSSASLLARQNFMNGEPGGNGAEFATACNSTSRGLGGGGGSNSCSVAGGRAMDAGAGGHGGTMDSNCGITSDLDARPGSAGGFAAYSADGAGTAGNGGSGASSCGPTTGGGDGAVTDGVGGARSLDAVLVGQRLRAGNGGNGSVGTNGSGGGGGGGSGGCDQGTDAYGPGGGGGGAGGCAAISGGQGGKGGGSSIGIAVFEASLALEDVVIDAGAGGDGGDGGGGGFGQQGGLGAPGGDNPGTALPGHGGDGARGGHSGAGAGGNGGHSIGIFHFDATISGSAATTLGPAGAAGAGGAGNSLPGAGEPGLAGTALLDWQCASPSGC